MPGESRGQRSLVSYSPWGHKESGTTEQLTWNKNENLRSTKTSVLLGWVMLANPSAFLGFSDSSVGKESACNTGDPSSIPGSGISAGEQIGYPLQYSWPGKSPCIVHGVTKSWTQLSDFHLQALQFRMRKTEIFLFNPLIFSLLS